MAGPSFETDHPPRNLKAALHAAAAGIPILLVKEDKSPLLSGWQQNSTTDRTKIERLFGQYPHAIFGIDLGKAKLVVIDCDKHAPEADGVAAFDDLVEKFGGLPEGVPVVRTRSGGLHYYFVLPEGVEIKNWVGLLAPGIDIKTIGGFVVGPGASLSNGGKWAVAPGFPDLAAAYQAGTIPFIPEWLVKEILAKVSRPQEQAAAEEETLKSQSTNSEVGTRDLAFAAAALQSKAAEVAAAPKGTRNRNLYNAAFRLGTMVASGAIDVQTVRSSLRAACEMNGLIKDDGLRSFNTTFASGIAGGAKAPHPPLGEREAFEDAEALKFGNEFAESRINRTAGEYGPRPNMEDEAHEPREERQSGSSCQEAPRPLYRPLPPAAKYPVEALGNILAPAARAIMDRVQCPDALAAQSVLAFASLAVQAHADVEIPATGHTKPVSLNMLAIASSGDRKSGADIEASWPIRKHEQALREAFNADMKEYLKAKKAWDAAEKKTLNTQKDDFGATKGKLDALGEAPAAPILPMKTCPEPTYEGLCKTLELGQPSMGIFSDEGGSFISGHGMSPDNRLRTIAGLSSLWDGSPIKRVRVGDGASILAGKRLAVYLMVQPDAAGRLLSDPVVRDQGFLSRFLISAPDSTAGTRFQREPHPASAEALKRYGARILSILDRPAPLARDAQNELEPRVLTFDRDAAAAWRAFADHVEGLLASGQPFEPIRGFANKLPEHAARIAAVLTLVDDLYVHAISRETFERAVVLAEYYAHEALRLFGTGCASPELQRAEALRKWLLTRWDESLIGLAAIYQKGPTTLRDAKTARDAVKVLVEHGWLIPTTGPATVEGKTVREAWRIVKEGGQ